MTVSATNANSGPFTGNGSTTAFPFTFEVVTADEVKVLVNDVAQSSGFTTTVNAGGAGGTVTFTTPPANGAVILLSSNPAFDQEISFLNAGAFLPETHDEALDRAAMRDIRLRQDTTDVANDLAAETADRIATVTAETAARISGETSLQTGLATETNARLGADSTLTTNLNAEIANRSSEDFALQSMILAASAAIGSAGANPQLGPVFLEWYGGSGNGVVNNAAALALAGASPCTIRLRPGNYAFDTLVIPAGVVINGSGRKSTTITITGDGGGAPALGVNGGVQAFTVGSSLRDCLVQYSNPALQCLVNPSHAVVTGRSTFERVDASPGPGITAAQSNAIALFAGGLNEFVWSEGHIGMSPAAQTGFKQNTVFRGFFNGCRLSNVTLQQHAIDIPNGVFHTAYPQLDMDHGTDGATFDNLTFENGPNGAAIRGAGTINGDGWYMADCPNAKNDIGWLPSQVVAQGDRIFPSASITATSDGSTAVLTGVSSTAAIYKNMKLSCPGMGAAGATLTARVLSFTTNTITLDANTGTANTGSIYYGAYDSHGYICKTAGTTGSSPPAWPTAFQGEVADNTVTWKEHGTCAWIDANCGTGQTGKNTINLRGHYIGNNICGISAVASGSGTIGSIILDGVEFELNNHAGRFDGVESVRIFSKAISYKNFGFEFLGRTQVCANNQVCFRRPQTVPNGADVVVTTNNGNMSGTAFGNFNLTGLGAGKWFQFNTANAPASFFAPGAITAAGQITANGTAAGVGYSVGAGASATQATNKTTAVTVNRPCGEITMNAAALAGTTIVSFTFNNTQIAADDDVRVWVKGGLATPGSYRVAAEGNASGSRTVVVENKTGGSLSEALILGFSVVKAVVS